MTSLSLKHYYTSAWVNPPFLLAARCFNHSSYMDAYKLYCLISINISQENMVKISTYCTVESLILRCSTTQYLPKYFPIEV